MKFNCTCYMKNVAVFIKSPRFRTGLCFWVFGLCNNFPYVIMLSAAHDILRYDTNDTDNVNVTNSITGNRINLHCTPIGTGAVLIADIMPTFIFKLVAPLFIQNIKFPYKISFISVAAILSFIVVALSGSVPLTLFGVVLASLASGVGEVSFLSLTAFYDTYSVSFWSSGTGGAGVFGALAYAGLTSVLSPRNTLFVVSIFPIFMIISYFLILQKPLDESFMWTCSSKYELLSDDGKMKTSALSSASGQQEPPLKMKLKLITKFLYLTIPLALVYFAEYVINQGLFELLFIPTSILSPHEQYRWFQVTYQAGVFVSRSSINIVKVEKTWIFTVLQCINFTILICQVAFRYIPYLWLIFIIIVFEGLMGGGAYVNTFYFILSKSQPEYREFNMAAGSLWDSIGILIAGFVSVPLHNVLCDKFSA